MIGLLVTVGLLIGFVLVLRVLLRLTGELCWLQAVSEILELPDLAWSDREAVNRATSQMLYRYDTGRNDPLRRARQTAKRHRKEVEAREH